MKSLIASMLLVLFSFSTSLYAEEKIGVVLMHGKWGTSSPNSPVGGLTEFLSGNGLLVSSPDMPWSSDRGLDKSYEDSMNEIDEVVNELRSKGATKIVVGGHSIGANAALGYGASRDGLAGILAIAPGHVPDVRGFSKKMDNDWQRAQEMVNSGKGTEVTEFKDFNQGRQSEKDIQASIYLSWYDPEGSAVMPTNVANLKEGTPLLWIIGENDRMYNRGPDYAFSNAPEHPKNAYVVVDGGHKDTPETGQDKILNWLNSL